MDAPDLVSSSVSAQHNKRLVLDAFDTLFNRRDYDAASRLWSDAYVQHSTQIGPGWAGLLARVHSLPDLRYENVLAIAEGEYVVLHGRFSGNGQPRAMIVANILRIENDRLTEHWDVIEYEVTPEESKSGLPMIGGRRTGPNGTDAVDREDR